jgi:hypothetical protein
MKQYAMGGDCSSHGREKMLAGNSEEERPLGGPGFDGRILLKWILEKQSGRIHTGLFRFKTGISGGSLRSR